jgi:hypothetical protein
MIYNTNEPKEGVLNGSIPSTFVDSAATSSDRTKKDQARNAFVLTGQQLDKAFCMPNGAVEAVTAMDKLHHELQLPTIDVYKLYHRSNSTHYSANPSLSMQIILQSLTKM